MTQTRPTITSVQSTEQRTSSCLKSGCSIFSTATRSTSGFHTEQVQIEAGVIPHSHPILTLIPQTRGADYLADSERLLGTYIHEQLHWFLQLESTFEAYKNASSELRSLYPDLPTERPEGCGSDRSNYLHIQVNYLEYRALRELLGEAEARMVIERVPYYTAIYALVLRDYGQIGKLMTKYRLIPNEQPPELKRFIATA